MKYALIDNGHGCTSVNGSPDRKILEYVYAREIASAVYDRLDKCPDITPILITPEREDIPLAERVRRINKYVAKYGANNCMMVSIHLDASGNGQWMNARGWSCYTTRKQNNSDKLATVFYNVAIGLFGIDRCRKDYSDGDPDCEANFYIIKHANCAAVLSENFFQDNKKDVEYLLTPEGFNSIVALHVQAIKMWFGIA